MNLFKRIIYGGGRGSHSKSINLVLHLYNFNKVKPDESIITVCL